MVSVLDPTLLFRPVWLCEIHHLVADVFCLFDSDFLQALVSHGKSLYDRANEHVIIDLHLVILFSRNTSRSPWQSVRRQRFFPVPSDRKLASFSFGSVGFLESACLNAWSSVRPATACDPFQLWTFSVQSEIQRISHSTRWLRTLPSPPGRTFAQCLSAILSFFLE